MRRFVTCLMTLSLSMLLVSWPAVAEEATEDWPQFRGPSRDGVAPAAGILESWPTDGPKQLWKQPIGTGFSGLVVAQGKIFTMMAEGEEELAVAFDAADGKESWRVVVGKEFPSEFGDGPRSTPAVADGRAFVLGSYGNLKALSAEDGSELWAIDLRQRFGSVVPSHGFSTAPLIEGELLLVEVGGGEGQAYAALDPKTGATRWTTHDGSPTYTSPISVNVGGAPQLVSVGNNEIVGFDHDGKLAWSYPWRGGIAMPIFVAPDKLFFSSSRGSWLARLGQKGDEVSVEQVWESSEMKNHFNSSVIHEGHVYGFDNMILKCVDLATGERQWARRGFGKGSLIVAGEHLLILGERGALAQAKASPEGYVEEGRVQALDGKSWTSPTLVGGRLYLRNLNEMVAFDLHG